MSIIGGTHRATQESQARGYQWFQSGVQGTAPVVRPIAAPILVRQEAPWHPGSWVAAGVQGPNVRPPVSDRIITTQEMPRQPASTFSSGVPAAVAQQPPRTDRVLTAQESPWHPSSFLRPSIPVSAATPLQGAQTVGTPQVPAQPSSWFFASPPLAAATQRAVVGSIFGTQESPPQPPSFTWFPSNFAAKIIIPLGMRAATVQQPPWHPGSFYISGVPGANVTPPPPASGAGVFLLVNI